jgi:hypothetical protein
LWKELVNQEKFASAVLNLKWLKQQIIELLTLVLPAQYFI